MSHLPPRIVHPHTIGIVWLSAVCQRPAVWSKLCFRGLSSFEELLLLFRNPHWLIQIRSNVTFINEGRTNPWCSCAGTYRWTQCVTNCTLFFRGGGQPVSKLKRPDVPPPEATRLIAPSIKDGINVLGGEMLRERPRCAFPLRLFQF